MLSLTALVLLAGALSMTVTAVGVGQTRAAAAADLAALAGAGHLSEGSACRWAREVARRNSADLSDCRAGARDITVSTTVPVHLPFWPFSGTASVRASARAGPDAGEVAHVASANPKVRHLALFHSLSCLQPIRCG